MAAVATPLTVTEIIQISAVGAVGIVLLLVVLWALSRLINCLGRAGSAVRFILLNWLATGMLLLTLYIASQYSESVKRTFIVARATLDAALPPSHNTQTVAKSTVNTASWVWQLTLNQIASSNATQIVKEAVSKFFNWFFFTAYCP